MPLSTPAEREEIHTRTVVCQGYRRADGLWDIEGHLTDVKTYTFENDWRGEVEPGDPIHEMRIRLTIDDNFEVKGIEAVTDKSPYPICPAITSHFQRLVGLRIAPGWTKAVKERVGGIEGCTHLVEMLGPIATTAFQTIHPLKARERKERLESGPSGRKPPLLNTCHAFRSDGDLARRYWPAFYTGE